MKNGISFETKRVLTLYLMGFILVFGYAFARTCIDSIFLMHYSSDDLPKAWLLTSLASLVVIAIYNKVNQYYSILSLYGAASLLWAAMLLALLSAYFMGFIPAIFILYVWKEIYMVMLMETYWSYADLTFSVSSARHTYGGAMAICSLGGVLGNLLVGPAARSLGTENVVWWLIGFLVLGFIISFLGRGFGDEKPKNKGKTDVSLGLKTLFNSKYLVPLAILACTVQMVTGLLDYKFNGLLQENYLNIDARTEILGNLHALINTISISIQLCMGPILRIFGIGNTFKSIPLLLSGAMLFFILVPHFALFLVVKVANKSFDYSLFRGVKEILYIPLSREEKTQGKGIIDIFMYRMARGLSSLILMAMISLGLSAYVMQASLGLALLWFALSFIIVRRYQKLASEENA
jgi:AAA family ATP:ADP antiporter